MHLTDLITLGFLQLPVHGFVTASLKALMEKNGSNKIKANMPKKLLSNLFYYRLGQKKKGIKRGIKQQHHKAVEAPSIIS